MKIGLSLMAVGAILTIMVPVIILVFLLLF